MSEQSQDETQEFKSALEEHAQYLGRIAMAWNYIHTILAMLFLKIAHPKDDEMGSTIWNAVTNDRMQRKMLQAAIKASTRLPRGYKSRLEWAMHEVNELENQRDTALHAPYDHDAAKKRMVATHQSGHLRALQLQHTEDLGELFHANAMDMLGLGYYLALLSLRLQFGDESKPWPKKPSLQRARPPKSPAGQGQKTTPR